MAAPTSDTPEVRLLPPSPASAAAAGIRIQLEALDLTEDVPLARRQLEQLETLPCSRLSAEEDLMRGGEESSDEEHASYQSDKARPYSMYGSQKTSLSPLSESNFEGSLALLSSASSSETLSSLSSRAKPRRSHRTQRSSLQPRRMQTRSRSDKRRSYSPQYRDRDRLRRRWHDSKRRDYSDNETEKETLESKLVKILRTQSSRNTFLQQKHHRYFQKKGKNLSEWEKSKECKVNQQSEPLSSIEEPSHVSAQMQETTRDPPHLLRLNSGYQILTREYLAFRSNLPMLYKTIESQLSVPLLSTEMYSNLLITDEVKHEVTVGDPQRSIQRLLDALGAQISNNEAHFYTFLNILQQKPALEDCCTKLLEKCRQLEPIREYAVPVTPLERYTEHLKEEYLRGDFPKKWTDVTMTKFIKLVTTEEKTHRFISMQDMFQDEGGSSVNRVLVKGGPGIGKSMFAFELCKRWGLGEMFQQFSLVLLLPLCYRVVRKAKSLSDLIHTHCNVEKDQEAIVRAISSNEGEGILLILEGFNELPVTEETEETREFLLRLFALTVLPRASVLVTTRPHFRTECNARIIQIDGFGKDEVQEYIREAELSDEQQSSLNEYLLLHPDIHKMIYNPLYCAMLVKLYQKHGMKTLPPKTSTQLFNQLVKYLVLQYREENGKSATSLKCEDFPKCLPSSEYGEYSKLCELAHETFVRGQAEFGLTERFDHFNLLEESRKPFEANITYHFLHQSLQEYLTAYWILEHYKPEDQLKLLKKHLDNPGCYEHVLRFLAGLSVTLDWEELAKCAFVDRQALDIASFYLDNDVQGVQLPFLTWLLENQDTEVCANVLGKGTIGFYSKSHATPLDYHALAYCIANSECKWEVQIQLPSVNWLDTFSKSFGSFQATKTYGGTIRAIDIGHCQISEVGWNLLFSDSKNPLQSLRQLILYDTVPPPTVLQYFPDHLPKLRHLQCLALSKTPLGEGGAVSLMETLPNTEVSELHLCKTGIGFLDCQALAPYLSDQQCKLKSLDVSYNDLTEESVNVFTNALVHNISLTKLSMSGSTFSPEAFLALVSRLKGSPKRIPLTVLHLQRCVLPQRSVGQLCTVVAKEEECALQSLALGYNPLELSDIKALAIMLEKNNSIVFLYLKNCSVSTAGFSALSSSLRKNTTLCELSLSGNELSQENINAVCQGFFSEARFACENLPNMLAPPLLCLDSCPDEWKTAIIDNASECLQMYHLFQETRNQTLPDIEKFLSNTKQKQRICSHYIHFDEHNPSCGRDRIEEMRPSYIP